MRKIRVYHEPIVFADYNVGDLQFVDEVEDSFYGLAAMLRLVPGLRLDKLTVVGESREPEPMYNAVNALIDEGEGPKELQYIGKTHILTYRLDEGLHLTHKRNVHQCMAKGVEGAPRQGVEALGRYRGSLAAWEWSQIRQRTGL